MLIYNINVLIRIMKSNSSVWGSFISYFQRQDQFPFNISHCTETVWDTVLSINTIQRVFDFDKSILEPRLWVINYIDICRDSTPLPPAPLYMSRDVPEGG